MQVISTGTLLLAAVTCAMASRLGQYVEPKSVRCDSNGIAFDLTTDNTTSKLYIDTGLNVTLSSGPGYNCSIGNDDFNQTSGHVFMNYTQCPIVSIASATGLDQRPLFYLIEQPFRATSISSGADYYFKIFCWIPASYHINVTRRTEDEGNTGDPTGAKIKPGEHVHFDISGAKEDEKIPLGQILTYQVAIKDNVYDAVLPINCYFYDVERPSQKIPFVQNGCPVHFPDDDIDEYFHTMVKHDRKTYDIQFRAFSFGGEKVDSKLGIDCDILLCISYDIRNCTKTCWNETTTAAPEKTTVSEGSGGESSTTAAETPTETPDPATTTGPTEGRKKRDLGNFRAADDVRSTTYHDQKILNIATSGGGDNPKVQPADSNVLTNGLYAVMGALALVALALAAVVAIFLYRSRGAKTAGNDREMIFAHRQASIYDTRGQPLVRGA